MNESQDVLEASILLLIKRQKRTAAGEQVGLIRLNRQFVCLLNTTWIRFRMNTQKGSYIEEEEEEEEEQSVHMQLFLKGFGQILTAVT